VLQAIESSVKHIFTLPSSTCTCRNQNSDIISRFKLHFADKFMQQTPPPPAIDHCWVHTPPGQIWKVVQYPCCKIPPGGIRWHCTG